METKKTPEESMQEVLDRQTVEDILFGLSFMAKPGASSNPDEVAIAAALHEETQKRLAEVSGEPERLAIARAARDAFEKVQKESLRAVSAAGATVTLRKIQSGLQVSDVVRKENEATVAAYTQPIPTWAMELACRN